MFPASLFAQAIHSGGPTPMPESYLRQLFSAHRDFASKADAVIERCRAAQQPGESLTAVLVRLGVFQPAAVRTTELMRKGFVSADVGVLLAADGPARLAALLAESTTEKVSAVALVPSAAVRTERVPALAVVRPTRGETVPEIKASAHTSGGSIHQSAPPAANGPTVGAVLGRCLLTAVLGRGGHGVVYAALHQSLNIPVAVKVLLTGNGPDPNVQAKLRHEARALARLSHPNIVRILDFDDGDPPYAVMEFVEGPSLADLITQTGGLRVDRARSIIAQVCRGLAAAWAEGIVHRDIKPANILLTRGGEAKIADLGLALTGAVGDTLPGGGGAPIGTCAYMAPEQALTANEVDFTADMYSLGVTFYQAVTGRHPFNAKSVHEFLLKHATQDPTPPHVLTPHLVDEATSAVIMRMIAKKPEDRFASYGELIALLDQPDSPLPEPTHSSLRLKLKTAELVTKAAETTRTSGLIGRLFTFRPK